MKKQYQAYQSPKGVLPSVEFWDRKFSQMNLWWDWVIMKTIVENEISTIMQTCQIAKKDATRVAWSAFCLAEERNNPLRSSFLEFKQSVSPNEQIYLRSYLMIGRLIHQGRKEEEAIKDFQDMIKEEKLLSPEEQEAPKTAPSKIQLPQVVHQISENLPYVRYWNKHFQGLYFWDDFANLKQEIEKQSLKLVQTIEIPIKDAIRLSWSSYIDAVLGVQSSVLTEYTHLVQNISDAELPLYLAHTTIGTDIFDGISENVAQLHYLSWLEAHPKNPIFGDYVLHKDFVVRRRAKVRSSRSKK